MPVVCLGLNHKSAPLAVREQVVLPAERLDAALEALSARPGVREAAVVSTCNRTEIYAVLAPEATSAILQRWLENEHALSREWLSPYLYHLEEQEAIRHLLRVAAGLDSLVLGEPQILGQAKIAYHSASRAGLLGQILQRLFQHAFSVAKRVRTETDIGSRPVSVASIAVTLARQIFGDLTSQRALLIGAGEMIEMTVRHLSEQGMTDLIIANRSLPRAERIATACRGQAISLAELPNTVAGADIIVSCTASNEPILGYDDIQQAMKSRRHRPCFIVDLAVPRDIEASVEKLPDIYLYTVDDLRHVSEQGQRSRAAAADDAERIITEQADAFIDWLRTLDAVGAIRRFRQAAERDRNEALQQARRQIEAGQPVDAVLEKLAHRLTRKLLHAPTMGLRDAARSGKDSVIQQSQRMLGVNDSEDEHRDE